MGLWYFWLHFEDVSFSLLVKKFCNIKVVISLSLSTVWGWEKDIQNFSRLRSKLMSPPRRGGERSENWPGPFLHLLWGVRAWLLTAGNYLQKLRDALTQNFTQPGGELIQTPVRLEAVNNLPYGCPRSSCASSIHYPFQLHLIKSCFTYFKYWMCVVW